MKERGERAWRKGWRGGTAAYTEGGNSLDHGEVLGRREGIVGRRKITLLDAATRSQTALDVNLLWGHLDCWLWMGDVKVVEKDEVAKSSIEPTSELAAAIFWSPLRKASRVRDSTGGKCLPTYVTQIARA